MKQRKKILIYILATTISFLSVFSVLNFRVPEVNAFAAITFSPKEWWEAIKKNWVSYASRVAMRQTARIIRNKLITGNNGSPTFVTNWRNYSRKSQDSGSVIARKLLGEAAYGVNGNPETAVICEHLRDAIAGKYQAQMVDDDFAKISRAYRIDSEQTFKLAARCTLPKTVVVDGVEKPFDMEAYRENFEGGWAVFEKLFEPQNNLNGLSAMVEAEIAKQREAENQAALRDATAGGGFTSITNKLGQIKTPGSYVKSIANSAADSALRCLETVEDFSGLGICLSQVIPDIINGQLTNLRNIGEDLGLLDDRSSEPQYNFDCDPELASCECDANEDGVCDENDDLATLPDTAVVDAGVCQEMASETAQSVCEATIPEPVEGADQETVDAYQEEMENCLREQYNEAVEAIGTDFCGTETP